MKHHRIIGTESITAPPPIITPDPQPHSVWAPWHDLKVCVVGSAPPTTYFDTVRDAAVREPLTDMLQQTHEDLDQLALTLSDMGVDVRRPSITDIQMPADAHQPMRRPLHVQPRDMAVQLGPHLCYRGMRDRAILAPAVGDPDALSLESAWAELMACGLAMEPPSWNLCGWDLTVDLWNHRTCHSDQELRAWCDRWLPGVTVRTVDAGCHTDAWYQQIRPGLVMCCGDDQDVAQIEAHHPGWTVHRIPDGKRDVRQWQRRAEHGEWWLPDAEHNPGMAKFVRSYLDDWLGSPGESSFEVNILMVNDHTMIAGQYDEDIKQWCRSQGIELVVTPVRHRHFWDGAVSCFTLPVHREGEPEHYIQS